MFPLPPALPPPVRAILKQVVPPYRHAECRFIQTHLSYVLVVGERVYKIKKAIDLGFADFRELEVRRRMCEREVALNRRLAPDVYLGVVPIRGPGRATQATNIADSEIIDYAVVMRRLDERNSLAGLLQTGMAGEREVQKIAARLAAFHAGAGRSVENDVFGSRSVVLYNHLENVRQVCPWIGRTVPRQRFRSIRSRLDRFLRTNRSLFQERMRQGRVRDCHGDVRAEHIFMDDPVVIIDCVEFADRFRFGDVASEVAFLVVDLEALGRTDLAEAFVRAYVGCSRDRGLLDVLNFYAAYRAVVRGKVLSIRSDEAEVPADERKQDRRAARKMFEIAQQHAHAAERSISAAA